MTLLTTTPATWWDLAPTLALGVAAVVLNMLKGGRL